MFFPEFPRQSLWKVFIRFITPAFIRRRRVIKALTSPMPLLRTIHARSIAHRLPSVSPKDSTSYEIFELTPVDTSDKGA